ncbi:MAG: hypothetical protein O2894_14185 [Planctomycetota bacterium]|nr:hypothetical protein [Planctomycetota bacterium]
MGSIGSWFGGRTVATFVDRARKKLALGKLEDAARIVEQGLAQFPGSGSLLDLRLSLRRARANKTMRRLEARIDATRDAFAYEELIKLYRELELPDEARRRAEGYCEAHPQRDTPHLVLGEMDLHAFLDEFSARHGYSAHGHLVQAANLNALALQPRLLLAELYFCIGADRSLAAVLAALRSMAPNTEEMQAALALMERVANPDAEERFDGLFERIEVGGELVRDPQDWPLTTRRASRSQVNEERAQPLVQRLLSQGAMEEVVVLRRDGTVMTHATAGASAPEAAGTLIKPAAAAAGFIEVVRTVGRKVFPQAREFDMGKFKRCTIRGDFGNVVVGRVGNVMVGVRGPQSTDPTRMWDALAMRLESVCGGEA